MIDVSGLEKLPSTMFNKPQHGYPITAWNSIPATMIGDPSLNRVAAVNEQASTKFSGSGLVTAVGLKNIYYRDQWTEDMDSQYGGSVCSGRLSEIMSPRNSCVSQTSTTPLHHPQRLRKSLFVEQGWIHCGALIKVLLSVQVTTWSNAAFTL